MCKVINKKIKNDPEEDECEAFFISSTTDSQLEKYRNDAITLLGDLVANANSEDLKKYEEDMLNDYRSHIKAVLPPWWHNVMWSVLASFIFSAMGLLFYHIGKNQITDSSVQKIELSIKADSTYHIEPAIIEKKLTK